jgi:hypothetical protein
MMIAAISRYGPKGRKETSDAKRMGKSALFVPPIENGRPVQR